MLTKPNDSATMNHLIFMVVVWNSVLMTEAVPLQHPLLSLTCALRKTYNIVPNYHESRNLHQHCCCFWIESTVKLNVHHRCTITFSAVQFLRVCRLCRQVRPIPPQSVINCKTNVASEIHACTAVLLISVWAFQERLQVVIAAVTAASFAYLPSTHSTAATDSYLLPLITAALFKCVSTATGTGNYQVHVHTCVCACRMQSQTLRVLTRSGKAPNTNWKHTDSTIMLIYCRYGNCTACMEAAPINYVSHTLCP